MKRALSALWSMFIHGEVQGHDTVGTDPREGQPPREDRDRCEHLVEPLRQAVSVAATPHPSLVLAVSQVLVRMTSCWVARVIAT
jgi:hypothetical protein